MFAQHLCAPPLSSVLEHFERRNVIEIHNGIMISTRDYHMCVRVSYYNELLHGRIVLQTVVSKMLTLNLSACLPE